MAAARGKKSLLNLSVRSKEDLDRFQYKPNGKPYTPKEFYLFEKGGLLAIAKLQTELGRILTENLLVNITAKEILNIVESKDFADAFIDRIDAQDVHKLSPLKEVLREDRLNSNFTYFSQKLSELARKVEQNNLEQEKIIDGKGNELEKEVKIKNLDKRKKTLVKDFVDQVLYKQEYVKTAKELLPAGKIDAYERAYKDFIEGGEVEHEGEKKWQLGWDETQSIIRKRISSLRSSIEKKEEQVDKHEFHRLISGTSHADMRTVKKKEGSAAIMRDYSKVNAELGVELHQLSLYRLLSEAAERYRNHGEKFDPSLWKCFISDNPGGSRDGGVYKYLPPKQDWEYKEEDVNRKGKPPYAELSNALAEQLGVVVIDNGAKSFESALRKLEDPKFNGNPAGIHDTVRITLAVSKMKGVNFLIKNLMDYSNSNGLPINVDREHLYSSFLFATTINMGVKVEIDGATHMRIAEIKVIGKEQMRVKPICDKIYDVRRLLKRDAGKQKQFVKPEDLDRADREEISSKVKSLFENKRVQEVAAATGFKLTNKLSESFDSEQSLKQLHTDLTKLERIIFLDALSKEDPKIKQLAFNAFMCGYEPKRIEGKEPLKPKFTEEDLNQFETAYTSKQLKEFEKEFRRARNEPYKTRYL